MSHIFEVGEIAEVVGPSAGYHGNKYGFQRGDLVTVVADLRCRRFQDGERHDCYLVKRPGDDRRYRALPQWLRKRRPPSDPAYLKFRERLQRQEKWLEGALAPVRKEFSL